MFLADSVPTQLGSAATVTANPENPQAAYQIANVPAEAPIQLMSGAYAGGGGFDLSIQDGSLVLEMTPQGGDQPSTTTVIGGGAGKVAKTNVIMPGQVQSGTGNSYSVTVYPNGRSKAGKDVTVTQLQITSSDTIPAGTWAWVTAEADGSYSMIVPTFL